jgi:hypothetical protein
MGKISQYNDVPVPKLSDMLIGTSVGLNEDDQVENQTYNFTLQQLLDLFIPDIPSNSLQGVLDNGNTATQDINLFGKVTTTDLEVTNDATFNNAYFPENMYVPGLIFDETYVSGTDGQILSRTATGVKWITIPPIFTPNLQQVLNVGNIASTNIQLSATLFADAVDSDDITSNTSLTVSGELVDGNGSSGLNNQVLTSTGAGKVEWKNQSGYTGVAPIIVNNSTKEISITQADATHSGYLSSTDWNTFDSKQDGLFGTGLVKSTAGVITYVTDGSADWNSAYNDTITSAGVTGTTTKTLTLNQRDGGTITTSWTDISTAPVTSVFSRTGDVVAQTGDYTTTQVTEGTNLYFTNARSRDAISSSATGLTYTSATGVFSLTAGYSIPTDLSQLDWTAAYNNMIVSASVTGTSTKTLTLTQQDGGTVTASWSDDDTGLTSVGVSMPSAFTVSNSPLTSNGTIAITGAGTTGQFIDGTGALQSIPSLTGYVPYTGATTNVNLGEYGLTSGFLTFDTTPTGTPTSQGTMYWDDSRSTVALIMNGTTQHIGQDTYFYVKNSSGSSIPKGTAVRFAGTDGASGHILIAPFLADGTYPSTYFMGVTSETIANGSFGQVTNFGEIDGFDTSGYSAGALLYASTTVAGGYQTTAPSAPNNIVLIAATLNSKNNGAILVRPTYGLNINDDEGVLISSPTNNEGLFYDDTSDLWVNKTIAQALGYTPASLASFSASSPLSYNNTTGAFSIQQANGSQSGYLSSTDWSTFNSKQDTITLTTTGSSGSSTLVGSTLNVPTYTLSGLGGVPTSRTITINGNTQDLSANRVFNVGTVTSVTAISPVSSTGGATPVITMPPASDLNDGYLSAIDWVTFSNKQDAGSYITSLTGEATASGPGAASVTLSNSAVTGKVLTGVNITGGSISATDSILTAFGKVQNQINGLVGGSIYQGTWNASTNTPALASGVGTKGYYYIVSVAGSTNLDGITDWNVGDWAIYDGTAWQQVDNTDAVVSVNGFTGAVSLTTTNISEGTNLYYLDSRARGALSFVSGSGGYNSSTGVISIPTTTSQITNVSGYITLSSIGASSPLSYDSGTGVFSIQQANTSQSGFLSSTDWNTFNSKQGALTLTTTGTSGAATLIGNTLNIPQYADQYVGTVTSVGLSVPTGFAVSNTPVTSSGTIALSFASGYSLPTNTSQTNWDTAYTNRITSASSPLSISSNAISISQANTSTNGFLSSTDWNTFNGKQNALTNPITGTGSSGRVAFFSGTTTQTSDSNLFWDNTNKRLGIGTASPSYTLHTVGTTYLNGATQLAASATGLPSTTGPGWAAQSGSTYRHYIGDGTGYDLRFSLRNGGINYDRIIIQESGYMGLGTTPSYRLQLVDDSAAKPSTNTWTIASDERVKENINPYTKGLDTILAINPVTYDYNGKAGFAKIEGNVGVIAQDVLDVLPESISTYKAKLNEDDEEDTELYNFNSHALTYVLINAIKELKAEIEELKAQIKIQ